MRYRLRTLLILVAVACLLLGVIRTVATHVKPSIGYGFRAEFAELPIDDAALAEWLAEQPGVIKAFVNREPSSIRVHWIMSRDLTGNPPIPDCREQFDRFGYKGLKTFDRGG